MMINWLERHPGLVLERYGAGHFCRSAISRYNAQCETLNICCFFFFTIIYRGPSFSPSETLKECRWPCRTCFYLLSKNYNLMDYDRACGVTLLNWTNHASYLRPIFVKLICWYQKKLSNRIRLYQENRPSRTQQTISHVINVFRQKKS